VQSLLFALVGASAGLLVAKVGLAQIIAKFPFAVSRFQETTIDRTVIWFTVGMAVGAALLATVLPSLYTARLNINSELKGEWSWSALSKYRFLAQGALIVFEVALAASLSLVSGLLIKSFYEIEKVNLGFNPHGVLSFQISLPKNHYQDHALKTAFYDQVIQKLRAIPGVQSASGSYTLPLGTGTHFINLQVDSQSPLAVQRPFVDDSSILPGFFASMKIPILQGRDFTDSDRTGAPPVAIVDELLASRMWPGQSALGKHLRLADITDNSPPWREIVGVVRQIRYYGPEKDVGRLQVYVPAYQNSVPLVSFIMDTTISPEALRAPIEKAVHDVDPELPVDNFRTLDDYFDRIEASRRISLFLLSSFAAVGILLGMIGIYGVVSNSVVRRRREIAIRMALGSSVTRSIVLVTKLGLLSTLVGILLGSLIVFSLSKILSSLLFGVKPLDPLVCLVSAVAIAALASLASLTSVASLLRLHPQDVLRE
jgi:predicted permease